ncbi:MAG TPA: hypothetical protein VHL77_11470 [Ferruginibacter sp.]|nr:hypothetical protein [Ferruginibacter sp.]
MQVNKAFMIVMLVFIIACNSAYCQAGDTLITSGQFMGIKLEQTSFKEAAAILNQFAYKAPKLNFRSIRWRDGGCSTLHMHHYFVKVKRSKLHVTLYGYGSVSRIQISAQGKTGLSYMGLRLGRSRIGEIQFTGTGWERVTDVSGNSFLRNQFNGIRVDVAGDSVDVQKHNWPQQRINQITLIGAGSER